MSKRGEHTIMSKTYITDFTQGSVSKHLLVFAAPLFLSNMLQVVYNLVDMVIVGHVAGEVGLSAVSIGGDISSFLTFISMGFSSAGQVLIAQYIGAGYRDRVGKFICTMSSFLLTTAAVVGAVCLLLRQPILQLMNTPAESYQQTLDYATVCMFGMVFIYGYNIVSAVLRGMGDSKHPFVFISMAAVLNVILDIIFVIVLDFGAKGAALATVISQGVSFLSCVWFLGRNSEKFELHLKAEDFLHWDMPMLSALIKLGIPMAIKSAAIHFSKLFVNSWINSYGVSVSAVAGIANKFSSISNLFAQAINTAGASMVGQNIGAKKYDRVPKVMLTAFAITLTVATVLTVILVSAPYAVFGIFTDKAEVLEVCMEYLPVAILIFYGSAFRSCMNALLNGSGNYRINFVTAILDGMLMRIGLSVLFGLVLHMDYVGFWLGDALAGFTPFFIGIVYYFSGRWKKGQIV